MSKKALAKDVMVKLIVGAGQASPSPPVGPALGSKGVKSMDFCKEFNARTASYITGTPMNCRITVRPDRSFNFNIRTPSTSYLLMTTAGVKQVKNKMRGAGNTAGPRSSDATAMGGADRKSNVAGNSSVNHVGQVSLKHCYEIAKIKQSEERLSSLSLQGLVKSVVWQAGSMGILVVP